VEVFVGEVSFHDPGGLDTGPQNVLLRGDVAELRNPVQGIEVVGGGVVELVLPGSTEADLDARVRPALLHHARQLQGQLALLAPTRQSEEDPSLLLSPNTCL